MLRRRTTSPPAEFLLWYERSRPKGTDLDPAEVALRIRALVRGSLGPAASAHALWDAAAVADAEAEDCVQTIARIDAEYGEVFARVPYVSGKYLGPYETLIANRHHLALSRRLAQQLRSLAERQERRAARGRPRFRGLVGRPDVAALKEWGDTERLLRALDHRNDEVRVSAAIALADLRAMEAVDPLLRIIDGARPRGRAPSEELHNAAVGALAAIADPRTADLLVRYAHEHQHTFEETTALTGLVRMRDDRALELVTSYLWHGDVPTYAADLLGDLGDPRGIPVLRDYIADLERSDPQDERYRGVRDLRIEAARTALTRLDTSDK